MTFAREEGVARGPAATRGPAAAHGLDGAAAPVVCAVIPSYNPGRQLLEVLPRVEAEIGRDGIIVVDDGSADGSGEAAAAAGYTVVRHPQNRGKGAALRTGFAASLDRGATWVVTLDADGQHDPAEIRGFLAEAARGEHQLLVGTRMGDTRRMPPLRIVANRFTSWIISALAGQRIEDSQSGYRLIASEVLRAVRLEFDRYDGESEILVRAARAGFSIGAVPIRTIYGDEVSAIHPLVDSMRFVRLSWRLWRLR